MPKTMGEIDKNFALTPKIQREGMKFYSIDHAPFRIYGVFREGDRYRRMPEKVAKSVSDGLYNLHANTAGGRVRFRTDSTRVCLVATMDHIYKFPHCALSGVAGFDMYEKENTGYRFIATFVPPYHLTTEYECMVSVGAKELRDLTINFPLYSDVKELLIGIDEDAVLLAGEEYKNDLPMVYYGSSITQGGCASRPGTCYQGHICRRFDLDYVNLGFSGSAHGEDEMIDYLRDLPMSVFVQDYDHNSPDARHLRETGEKMYRAVRKTHPYIPIILMNRPKRFLTEEEQERKQEVTAIYEIARAEGDTNVYLLTDDELTAMAGDEGTVDGCHPTDLGFASMAKALGDLLATVRLAQTTRWKF